MRTIVIVVVLAPSVCPLHADEANAAPLDRTRYQ